MRPLSILAVGFALGMRHATDADHVVAVSTIVARTRRFGTAWLLGAVWGLGHTATIFLVGLAIIVFKAAIPPRLGLGMEFSVGLVLVLLGALNMAGFKLGAVGVPSHSHEHDHSDPSHRHSLEEEHVVSGPHSHPHVHEARLTWLEALVRNAGLFQLARAAAVGLVHGLAGSAAVALLVLAAIPDPRAGVFYLLVFGLGTLAGMMLLSVLMELSMLFAVRRWLDADRFLAFGTGFVSLLFGAWILYQTGFVDGLFLANPRWIPS